MYSWSCFCHEYGQSCRYGLTPQYTLTHLFNECYPWISWIFGFDVDALSVSLLKMWFLFSISLIISGHIVENSEMSFTSRPRFGQRSITWKVALQILLTFLLLSLPLEAIIYYTVLASEDYDTLVPQRACFILHFLCRFIYRFCHRGSLVAPLTLDLPDVSDLIRKEQGRIVKHCR